MIVYLDHNIIELYNISLSTLPSKLTLWLFASILQNADFYLNHKPEREQFIQIHSIRSEWFRKHNMTPSPQSKYIISRSPSIILNYINNDSDSLNHSNNNNSNI